MGFGHRIYKTYDPRARILKTIAEKLTEERGSRKWLDVAEEVEKVVMEKRKLWPNIEFYAAVARKSTKGESGEGWHPEQAVSREQALKMFTINAAYGAFEEADKGSIEVGKLADFTVLSADIMKIPAPEILKTRCEMTIIGGEIVYAK